jgi:hypothetical protein
MHYSFGGKKQLAQQGQRLGTLHSVKNAHFLSDNP